jgi:hypothetical protein
MVIDNRSNLFGIKIFFYIVIIITTIVKGKYNLSLFFISGVNIYQFKIKILGIQFFKFNTLWREGPFVRDIVFGMLVKS